MAQIILVTGGARSGKSDYAEELAQAGEGELYYLATCPVCQDDDPEMAARIAAHRQQRSGRGWRTIEEPVAIARTLIDLPSEALVLVDCLTVWVSNLMYAEHGATVLDESRLSVLAEEILAAARGRAGQLIMVTGEVGCGVVPESELGRRYRDLVGRCNRVMASGSDQVVHVVCGIPHVIKTGGTDTTR